jgi:hypothetical protein
MHSFGFPLKCVVFSTAVWWVLSLWAQVEVAVALYCPPAGAESTGGSNVPLSADTNPPLPSAVATPPPQPPAVAKPEATTPRRPPPRDPAKPADEGYDPTKDPGMGGKPPDIAGATQTGAQGASGHRPADTEATGTKPGLGGGEVTVIPTPPPPPDTPVSGLEPQPAQGGDWWCYSAATQEWYQVPMGPCPPPSWKPPRGAADEPAVRVPHDTLQPGGGMGDKPGQPMGPKSSGGMGDKPAKPAKPMGPACGPTTKCRCAGGGMGHIPCDKSKGACHCGKG